MPYIKPLPKEDCITNSVEGSKALEGFNQSSGNMGRGMTIEKYMLEVTRLPDGRIFTKSYKVGEQTQINRNITNQRNKAKQDKKKDLEEIKIVEGESY